MSNAIKSFRHVQENDNRHLSLIHVIKQFVSEVKQRRFGRMKFSVSTLHLVLWYCLSRLTSCEWAALSHTLERIDISEIGLVFAGSSLSPDLRNGTISTYFLGSGKLLKEKELVIRLVMMGAIRGELSFRILAFTSSQPGALLDGKLVIILCTSPLVMDWNINKVVLFWLGLRLRFTRMNSLCASNVEIVFLSKIRGFQSCHFSHIN